MELQTLFTVDSHKARMKFLAEIAAACGASRPNVRSTLEYYGRLHFKTSIKNSDEHKSAGYLRGLGFVHTSNLTTMGSALGDFSSDIYGSKWIHPLGIRVEVYSNFKFSPATFNIELEINKM